MQCGASKLLHRTAVGNAGRLPGILWRLAFGAVSWHAIGIPSENALAWAP